MTSQEDIYRLQLVGATTALKLIAKMSMNPHQKARDLGDIAQKALRRVQLVDPEEKQPGHFTNSTTIR
jgi:hypothetical protein